MAVPEDLLRQELELIIERRFGNDGAEALRPLVERAALAEAHWTARGIKIHLAEVLDGAQQGTPQLVKRAGDELPVLVLSLNSVIDALGGEPVTPPVSFWDAVKDSIHPVQGTLAVRETPMERLVLPAMPVDVVSAMVEPARS